VKVAVYSLTRDRLEYTKRCFGALREKAGYPFDHYVFDNGSTDGTQQWLQDEYQPAWFKPVAQNIGIARAANIVLDTLREKKPDLIVKCDNDCLVLTDGILASIVELYKRLNGRPWVLSPRVEGINRQPKRAREIELFGHRIGLTGIVGGLFHCVPSWIYFGYRYKEDLPLAYGNDGNFCEWLRAQRAAMGYIEDLSVQHCDTTDGQARRYPEYFARKRQEEGRA
jgi:glycosyltransferase involved in cell wall biosynthesis